MNRKEQTKNYDDIINLPHPTSKTHPRMSREDRAAQFAPFAALTGHGDAIKETARLTNNKLDLDEDTKGILNRKLQIIKESLGMDYLTTIIYFVPDKNKSGGEYVTLTSTVKKIDEFKHVVVMENGEIIPIECICDIDSVKNDVL